MEHFKLVKPKIITMKKIPFVNQMIAKAYKVPSSHDSIALITSDFEHSLFVSLDESTKEADAEVIFNTGFYGSRTPAYGEILAIISGENPTVIETSLKAMIDYMDEKAYYYCNGKGIRFFSHVIGSIGRLLSKESGLPEGEALAYLFAPPLEASFALDYALKNSDTELVKFFTPPTNTNFSGAYLTGSISECQSASLAFIKGLEEIVNNPIDQI
ncbi:MAG: ethanolamine utilization microcompartment protein EutL [Candidatus Sericytochromatia bacterium]